jgi:hypothetical protein
MSSGIFWPDKDNLGAFQKPAFGNKAKHLGFDDASKAIYAKGQAVVDAIGELYPDQHYEWQSAGFFTGIDLELGDYIEPIRDVVQVVTNALTLLKEVLQAINALANLGANILKLIVDKSIALMQEIINILNPSVSAHMLLIAPKVGNLGLTLNTEITSADTVTTKIAKSSEKTRLDFVEWLNGLDSKLPEAIGADVSKLVTTSSNKVTGGEYLLNTIGAKLQDKTDLSRPYLCPTSYCGGVGIFLGSNAIPQVLSAWNKLNSIFSTALVFPAQADSLPPIPKIVRHNLTELNPLELSKEDANTCSGSPGMDALEVTPIRPKTCIISGLEYVFVERHIYTYTTPAKNPTESSSRVSFTRDLHEVLSSQDTMRSMLQNKQGVQGFKSSIEHYSTMVVTTNTLVGTTPFNSPIPFPSWEKKKLGKFAPGYWHVLAVDYYYLSEKSSKDSEDKLAYLPLISDITTFKILDDESEIDLGFLQVAYTNRVDELLDPTGLSPRWLAASSAALLFPDIVSGLLNLLDTFKIFLYSLLDDALDWLANAIGTLSRILTYLQDILAKIDALLQFLIAIANLNSTVGASVLTFNGQGDSEALYKMFKEYLDPETASTSSAAPKSKTSVATAVVDDSKYQTALDTFKVDLQAAARLEPDTSLDQIGSVADNATKRKQVQDNALKHLRDGTHAKYPSVGAVWNSSYNMSPLFTKDMTTCGIVVLAHSPTYGRVQLLVNLCKFLFGDDENATAETELETLSNSGLLVDTVDLTPAETSEVVKPPTALFTEDMKLTDDPTQSPFDFCP